MLKDAFNAENQCLEVNTGYFSRSTENGFVSNIQ